MKYPVWSRIVRFLDSNGTETFGEPVEESVDAGLAMKEGKEVLAKVLKTETALNFNAQFTGEVIKIGKLLCPLRAEDVGTIRCIGLNYRDHAEELKLPTPSTPTLFLKAPSCLNSPTDPITPPHCVSDHSCQLDYEVELAIVIGETCKDVLESEAMQYVLGYMTSNDVTARTHQMAVSQWDHGKGFDGFAPMGPALVSSRVVPDPSVLKLKTTLNGRVMQDGAVKNMIFSVARIVSFLSEGTTLPKGTVIMTGTPSGIGISRSPPVCLVEGDELLVSISHGLGTLINPIVERRLSRMKDLSRI